MDISDMLFSPYTSIALKRAVFELMERYSITDASTPVLIPTATNDDINGSQHASGGGTDFSYEDASDSQIENASSLGYYEHFRSISSSGAPYTGNQYHGEGYMFAAVVVDPPAYAAELHI